jgi:hypothetical protein
MHLQRDCPKLTEHALDRVLEAFGKPTKTWALLPRSGSETRAANDFIQSIVEIRWKLFVSAFLLHPTVLTRRAVFMERPSKTSYGCQ